MMDNTRQIKGMKVNDKEQQTIFRKSSMALTILVLSIETRQSVIKTQLNQMISVAKLFSLQSDIHSHIKDTKGYMVEGCKMESCSINQNCA